MINIELLNKHIDTLNQQECINMICEFSRNLKRDYNRMQKASNHDLNDGFMISRANSTTNYANSHKANISYIQSKEYLVVLIELYNKKF